MPRVGRIPAPPPRHDYKQMVAVLTGLIGRQVQVGGAVGTLVEYGCPTCSINFAVDIENDEPFVFHPGDVWKISVYSENTGVGAIIIDFHQEI